MLQPVDGLMLSKTAFMGSNELAIFIDLHRFRAAFHTDKASHICNGDRIIVRAEAYCEENTYTDAGPLAVSEG